MGRLNVAKILAKRVKKKEHKAKKKKEHKAKKKLDKVGKVKAQINPAAVPSANASKSHQPTKPEKIKKSKESNQTNRSNQSILSQPQLPLPLESQSTSTEVSDLRLPKRPKIPQDPAEPLPDFIQLSDSPPPSPSAASISSISNRPKPTGGRTTKPPKPSPVQFNYALRFHIISKPTAVEMFVKDSTPHHEADKYFYVGFGSLTALYDAQRQMAEKNITVNIVKESIPKLYTTDELKAKLPRAVPTTKVKYVVYPQDVNDACKELTREAKEAKDSDVPVLGLDCEWRPNFNKGQNNPIAVIQLASAKTSVVFHIAQMSPVKKNIPSALYKLLLNPKIVKVVVGPEDITKFNEQHNVRINHIDIQQLPVSMRFQNIGLAGMTNVLLQKSVSKSSKLQRTNWEKRLNEKEIEYAALDAELTRQVFIKIKDLPLD